MAHTTTIFPQHGMLDGYRRGYEAQWQRMKDEKTIPVPEDSIPAKAFDAKGAAQPIDSVGVVFDLDEAVRDRLIERQQKILRRVRERNPELSECLRPIARTSIHGTIYLAGVGIPAERKEHLIKSTQARATEVSGAIPEICTTVGIENRLGPWVVTGISPETEEDLGHWKQLQASMGHLEFFPIYFIHASLLVLRRSVDDERAKKVLDEVLEGVRRESAIEPRFPVRLKKLHVTYARDFDHIDPAGEGLELLSAKAYRSARGRGCELMAHHLGLKDAEALSDPEYRDQLWALRGSFPEYFWPHVDAMMASVGSGGVDPRQLAALMQARKLQTALTGDEAVPIVQVNGVDARPRAGTLHAIMRAVEAGGLPLAIIHQAQSSQDHGLDLQLIFEHADEVRMARVARSVARLPDLPPAQPAPEETEPLSLVVKLPRGLIRLGDILQALDKYDPRIAVTVLLGHAHWEDYDWLDVELVIPKGRKNQVKTLVRFWASYRFTDTPVWVAEKGEETLGRGSSA